MPSLGITELLIILAVCGVLTISIIVIALVVFFITRKKPASVEYQEDSEI